MVDTAIHCVNEVVSIQVVLWHLKRRVNYVGSVVEKQGSVHWVRGNHLIVKRAKVRLLEKKEGQDHTALIANKLNEQQEEAEHKK